MANIDEKYSTCIKIKWKTDKKKKPLCRYSSNPIDKSQKEAQSMPQTPKDMTDQLYRLVNVLQ